MPKGLRRIYGFGHLHFITFSCYRRLPLLRTPRSRSVFLEVLGEMRERHKFKLVGYVVMPEHVHLLMSEPEIGTPSTAVQMLKQSVSHRLRELKGPTLTNRGLGTRNFKGESRARRGPHVQTGIGAEREIDQQAAFWQKRFYDFNVWTQKKKVEKLTYMHMNPVKRGLVARPDQWIWSSYSAYQGKGQVLIPINRVEP